VHRGAGGCPDQEAGIQATTASMAKSTADSQLATLMTQGLSFDERKKGVYPVYATSTQNSDKQRE